MTTHHAYDGKVEETCLTSHPKHLPCLQKARPVNSYNLAQRTLLKMAQLLLLAMRLEHLPAAIPDAYELAPLRNLLQLLDDHTQSFGFLPASAKSSCDCARNSMATSYSMQVLTGRSWERCFFLTPCYKFMTAALKATESIRDPEYNITL